MKDVCCRAKEVTIIYWIGKAVARFLDNFIFLVARLLRGLRELRYLMILE